MKDMVMIGVVKLCFVKNFSGSRGLVVCCLIVRKSKRLKVLSSIGF